MIRNLLLIVLSSQSMVSLGQDCAEFEIHLASIDSTFHPGRLLDRTDTVFNANRAFVDYTIERLLEEPTDRCFVSNRNLLPNIRVSECDSSLAIFEDTLLHGEICRITLKTREFKPDEHSIVSSTDFTHIDEVDSQYPYGGQYGLPEIEIDYIKIEVNGTSIEIPANAYRNFYHPNFCINDGFFRQVEAFQSLNGDYIYLYLYGGGAAGTYFAKLIFDKTKYITRIASDYYPLSIHSSFRKDFIGY